MDKVFENMPIDAREINKKYAEIQKSNLPQNMIYADDADFLTELEKKNDQHFTTAKTCLAKQNLFVNESKTEQLIIKRQTKREHEKWRNAIKLGSKLGDREDMERRKQLATVAMKDNYNIWKRRWTASTHKRLQLYRSLVKSILLYNCGTWAMTKFDEKKMDSFHRQQLRRVIGVHYPRTISNTKLYKHTRSQPLSTTIRERRWKLLGHILRLDANSPARKAMQYFFENRTAKKFLGRPRTTIVSTINRDIQSTKHKTPNFPLTPLISQVSLQNIGTKARNRKLWCKIVKQVVKSN